MIKKLWAICILCGCIFASGCNESNEEWTTAENQVEDHLVISEEVKEDISTQTIWVYVCGEVIRPGVYIFVQGDRVFQALEAAGGMTIDANGSYVNQARLLVDGEQIYVPSKASDCLNMEEKQDSRVNINIASVEELTTLSGIGSGRAQAIVEYRSEHGRFQDIEDIKQVSGIKEGLFEKIKDKIKVS